MEQQCIFGELMIMKGFIFTLDATFALVIAGVAVGVLAYAHFSSPFSFPVTTSESYSVAQSLLGTSLSAAGSFSQYALAAANASMGAQSSWPYFGRGGGLASFSSVGPQLPQLLFSYTAASSINSPISVDYGMAAFTAANTVYVVNASTGALILSKAIMGIPSYPIIYKGYVIYSNSTGYITEIAANGVVTWNSLPLSPIPSSPLTIAGGYIAYAASSSIELMSPLNGSVIASNALPTRGTTPAYASGEYVASTSNPGVQNYIGGFVLVGPNLQQVWNYALTSSHTTTPVIYGNVVMVGSGNQIYAFTLGGTLLWNSAFTNGNVLGGAATGGNAYFTVGNVVQTMNLSCGCRTGGYPITQTSANAIPSVTPGTLYVIANQIAFDAYSLSSNSTYLFNISLQSSDASPQESVALAYGNAYVSGNNVLYAFGTCRYLPSSSLLQAMASMYLHSGGGCADELLNASYPSRNTGIFINGTYAPSVRTALFSGNGLVLPGRMPNPTSTFSVSAWFNANAPGSFVSIYNASPGAGSNADFAAVSVGGSTPPYYFELVLNAESPAATSCQTSNSIYPGSWYSAVVTVTNYANVIIYINGNESISCPLSTVEVLPTLPALSIGGDRLTSSTFNGMLSDVQVYSGYLNSSGPATLYLSGLGGVPIANNQTVKSIAWYPLDGDTNDYSGYGNVGYSSNIVYVNARLAPPSLQHAFQVSSAAFPMSTGYGSSPLYNVSVVTWR